MIKTSLIYQDNSKMSEGVNQKIIRRGVWMFIRESEKKGGGTEQRQLRLFCMWCAD